jgi:hemoglobin/transferrin/lactoferrin receptor protein
MTHPHHSVRALRLAVHSALIALGGAGTASVHAQDSNAHQHQLSEITVTAARTAPAPRAAATVVLDADELARRNAIDMSAIARYEPLVSVPAAVSGSGNIWDGAGNTGFNVRGIEGNRISLDLDGIALPDAAAKPDATSMNSFGIGRDYVDPATLREVRIGAGTSAAGAGTPGLGGNIAFTTHAPQDYLGMDKDLYGSYAFGTSSAGGTRSHILTGAARSGTLQSLLLLVQRKGHEIENKGSVAANPDNWDSQALLGKFNWTLGAGHTLGLTLDAYRRDNLRGVINKLGALYPEGAQQDSHTSRTRASIEHRLEATMPGWFDSLESRLYVQDSKVEDHTGARYIAGGQPYIRNIDTGYLNKAAGLASDAFLGLGEESALHYGVAFERNESKRPWREDRTVISSGAHQVTLKNRMADMDTDKASAYLRAQLNLGGAYKTVLTPGLRGEYRKLAPKNLATYVVAVPAAARELKTETDSYFTPSLNLSVELTPDFTAYGQVSRGARLPSAAERTGTYDSFSYTGSGSGYAVLGNPNLDKETSTAFELGLKGTPAKGVRLSAALFRTNYDNFIDYVAQAPDPVNYPTISFGLYRPQNVGSARTWGAEASLRLALGAWSAPLAGVSLSASAGAAQGNSTNKLTGVKGGLASTLPRKATLGAAYDAPGAAWGLSLIAVATAARQAPPDVITGVSTPRFAVPGSGVVDFNAYWNAGKHAKLQLGVYNLGDKKYWDYATSRALAAGTSAVALADIERQARPGRNVAATLTVLY